MPPLLRLFGTPSIERPQRLEVPRHRPVWLLLVLAYRGAWVSRDELLALFWPEADESTARHALRLWLSRAKALPWATDVEIERQRLRWAPPTDVAAFRTALGSADWGVAVAWHRAPLLAGFSPPDVPSLDEWLLAEREALQAAARQAGLKAARQLAAGGDHGSAASLLRDLLAQDPLAEDVLAAYMQEASLGGQRDEALRRYQRFSEVLRSELGAVPLASTLHLAAAIERAEAPPADTSVLPLPPSIPAEVTHPPALVGRAEAVATLRDGRRPLTLVVGGAGVGKTRVLRDAVPDATWLHCREATRGVPLYPVASVVRAAPDALARLGAYASDVARLVPEFSSPPGDDPFGSDVAKTRLFEGLARLLESAPGPLVIDDVHWADPLTVELVAMIIERGRQRVVASQRPTEAPEAWRRRVADLRAGGQVDDVGLEQLDRDAVRAMLAGMIGTAEGPSLFAAWLHDRTGGNPLFVVETLKMLFERGSLEVAGGRWHTQLDALTRDYSELAVPPGVLQVIGRRVEHASEAARRVLDLACVAGEVWDVERLAPLVDLRQWQVVEALEELEAHGLVEAGGFSHDLVRATVYERLGATRRRHLHGLAAAASEGVRDPWIVAEHWLQADRPERAAAQFRAAGEHAAARGWWPQALKAADRALDLAADPAVLRLKAGVLLSMRATDAAAPLIETLIADDRRVWQAHGWVLRTHHAIRSGRLDLAVAAADAAMTAAQDAESALQLEALLALANAAALSGEQAAVIDRVRSSVEAWRDGLPPRLLAQALSNLAWLHTGLGEFAAALDLYRQAHAAARTAGDAYWSVWIAANTLYCCLETGDPTAALAVAEEALAEEPTDALEILRINLARAYLELGRDAEAIGLLEALLESCRDPSNRAVALGYLVELHARGANAVRSREALSEALALLPATDLDRARVRIVIAALRHGDRAQRAEVDGVAEGLRRAAVPGYVWRELEALRQGLAPGAAEA